MLTSSITSLTLFFFCDAGQFENRKQFTLESDIGHILMWTAKQEIWSEQKKKKKKILIKH